ncbi:MAG: protein kinase [Archangium sp.]|nr:protein kinase [Archangium sp.]MDP3570562.1 protein kinase [Archangium sp.]
MESPPGGLVVEQLTPVRHRTGFEELAGVSGGREVSVGVTNPDLFADDNASAAFAVAVRGALQITHRHVATTLAVETAGPRRWAVLWERFPGQTLDQVLSDRGTLLPDEAVSITVALAQALSAAHEVGVLHGGISPEWVTLVTGPMGLDTRLGGFGLALLPSFTGGKKPTIASDIAALGSLLHTLLTGVPPQGKVGQLPNNGLHLGAVLTKSLGIDVSGRFRSVAEFENALGEANRTHVSGGHVLPEDKAKPGGIALRTLGPWELQSLLGEGAMGQVFLGKHSLLGRQAAIKVLRPEQYQREDLIQRFFQEARSVNQINHEHIVEISDFGKELDADGKPTAVYFVMELLHGETLGARIAKGALTIERALHVTRQLASALAAAHRLGVVHRDVKTDNVFLIKRQGDAEYVKVLDFGVAKLTQPTSAAPTVSTMDGAIIGTPTSMSPEQASGGVVDQRADIYAVGVLLYLMLSGRLPIDADNFGKLIALLLTKPPPPLPPKNPLGETIPPELAAVVMQCLEKDPAKRPQSMDELIEALTEAPKLAAPPPSRRGLFMGLAVLALVAAGAGVMASWPKPPVVVEVIDAGAPVVAVELDAGAPLAVVVMPPADAGEPEPGEVEEMDAGTAVVKVVKPQKPVALTPALLTSVINRESGSVKKCILSHRTKLPPGAGAVKMKWVVQLSGAVTDIEVAEPTTIKGTALETCLIKALRGFRFPKNVGPTKGLSMPFTYKSEGAAPQ